MVWNVGRRAFLALGGAAAVWPLAARAQKQNKIKRIGVLMPFAEAEKFGQAQLAAFRDGLAALGWTAPGNVTFDYRYTAGSGDLVRTYARELIALAPDLIFTASTQLVTELHNQTQTIPILFGAASDPVEAGLVKSLARPGGNVTGFSTLQATTNVKFLELIKEMDPHVARVLVLMSSQDPSDGPRSRGIEAGGPSLNIAVSTADITGASDIDSAIANFASGPAGGLIVLPNTITNTHAGVIIKSAVQHKLPVIFTRGAFAVAGALAGYGPDQVDQYRRAASYADRILKGEAPGDLPIQAPTKFELVINLKTAKELGLTIPPTLLVTADRVIE